MQTPCHHAQAWWSVLSEVRQESAVTAPAHRRWRLSLPWNQRRLADKHELASEEANYFLNWLNPPWGTLPRKSPVVPTKDGPALLGGQ